MARIEFKGDNNESIIIDTSEHGKGKPSCNVEVLELVADGNIAKTVKTASEIEECYKSGKVVYSVVNIGAYIQIAFGLFLTPEQTGNEYVLYGYTKGDHANVENVVFTGHSADEPLAFDYSDFMK